MMHPRNWHVSIKLVVIFVGETALWWFLILLPKYNDKFPNPDVTMFVHLSAVAVGFVAPAMGYRWAFRSSPTLAALPCQWFILAVLTIVPPAMLVLRWFRHLTVAGIGY